MKKLMRNAYAKVNLALDVLRRREDGYHDVCMIMQNLSLYDTLTLRSQFPVTRSLCHVMSEILSIRRLHLWGRPII